jgi:hypothetical protein
VSQISGIRRLEILSMEMRIQCSVLRKAHDFRGPRRRDSRSSGSVTSRALPWIGMLHPNCEGTTGVHLEGDPSFPQPAELAPPAQGTDHRIAVGKVVNR